MRQYFADQPWYADVIYYVRISNPESIHPTELITKTAHQMDIDVLASELSFVEYVHHTKLGLNIPIFEKRV